MKISLLIILALGFVSLPIGLTAAQAADASTQDSSTRSLPLTAKFEKVIVDGNSTYVLKVKNLSQDSLKLSATIVPSVTFHANAKSRTIAGHLIAPGEMWTIEDLAAQDKVTLSAEGYDHVELTAH